MVIDLGEVRPVSEAAPPPAAAPLSPRMRRGLAACGAVVALLAAGGAAPVRGHLVEVVVATSAGHAFGGGDAVYAMDGATIARYELPDGRERWRVSVPANGRRQHAFTVGDMVLITGEGMESETLALDGETGARRWGRPGRPHRIGDDQVMLSHQRPGEPVVRYEMVDVATGVARWSLTAPEDDPTFYDDDRFVRWSLTGRVEVRDVRTGQVRVSGTVPPPDADAVLPHDTAGIQVVGDLVLVARQRGGRAMTDAYDLRRFTRRWTAAVDLGTEYLHQCGDLLCAGHYSGAGGVRVLETDTGRVRWSNDQWGWLDRIGPVFLSFGVPEQPPRVLALDAEDGRVRADFGRWDIGWPVGTDGRVLAVRPDSAGDTWIAELDLFAGSVRTLGVARRAFSCQSTDRVVICHGAGDAIGIWYPRRRLDE